jgi:hypothetical protein
MPAAYIMQLRPRNKHAMCVYTDMMGAVQLMGRVKTSIGEYDWWVPIDYNAYMHDLPYETVEVALELHLPRLIDLTRAAKLVMLRKSAIAKALHTIPKHPMATKTLLSAVNYLGTVVNHTHSAFLTGLPEAITWTSIPFTVQFSRDNMVDFDELLVMKDSKRTSEQSYTVRLTQFSKPDWSLRAHHALLYLFQDAMKVRDGFTEYIPISYTVKRNLQVHIKYVQHLLDTKAANIIKHAYREAMCNPQYAMCRRRLMAEFGDMPLEHVCVGVL